MVRLVEGRSKHRHDRIPDELVEHALVLEDAVGHPFEEPVQQQRGPRRRQGLRQRGKTHHVGKEHGHVAFLSEKRRVDLGTGLENPEDDTRRVIALQPFASKGLLMDVGIEPRLFDGDRSQIRENGK